MTDGTPADIRYKVYCKKYITLMDRNLRKMIKNKNFKIPGEKSGVYGFEVRIAQGIALTFFL